jgi:hypothetical protein
MKAEEQKIGDLKYKFAALLLTHKIGPKTI